MSHILHQHIGNDSFAPFKRHMMETNGGPYGYQPGIEPSINPPPLWLVNQIEPTNRYAHFGVNHSKGFDGPIQIQNQTYPSNLGWKTQFESAPYSINQHFWSMSTKARRKLFDDEQENLDSAVNSPQLYGEPRPRYEPTNNQIAKPDYRLHATVGGLAALMFLL